ncbi:MAG: hypothetical protein ACRD22_16180 [Terriglobia bacterium]
MLLATGLAFAGETSGAPFNISTPQSFREQSAQVRASLSPGGQYAFLSTQDHARVEQEIAAMDALFQRYGNIQAMDGAQRVELYNAQESANWILTRGRYGGIRCAWTPSTGTHIPHTRCWSMRSQGTEINRLIVNDNFCSFSDVYRRAGWLALKKQKVSS